MLTYHSDILLTPQVAEMVRELNLDAEAGDAQLTACLLYTSRCV